MRSDACAQRLLGLERTGPLFLLRPSDEIESLGRAEWKRKTMREAAVAEGLRLMRDGRSRDRGKTSMAYRLAME
jgi:hypothetical protein